MFELFLCVGSGRVTVLAIEVHDYDPVWQAQFEELKLRLLSVVESLCDRIEHVGSTSVPGLAAKPVLDIDIVLTDFDRLPEVIRGLERLGYQHRGDLGIEFREAFRQPESLVRHNLYVCLESSLAFKNHIRLRNQLRDSAKLRDQYSQIKKSLARQFPNDIDAYVAGKTDFILSVLERTGLTAAELGAIEEPNKNPS